MTATLQDAIAAARAGDRAGAQVLAAELVLAQPDDAQAWFLLSQLVDSDARRAAYVHKTLTLDPSHELARAEFNALPTDVISRLAQPAPERTADAPEPVAEEVVVVAEAVAPEPAATAVAVDAAPTTAQPPDWLQPLSPEPVARPAATAAVAGDVADVATDGATTPAAAPAPRKPAKAAPPAKQPSIWWSVGMALLVILTMFALGLLAYLLLTS